jgi:hypothetical protein
MNPASIITDEQTLRCVLDGGYDLRCKMDYAVSIDDIQSRPPRAVYVDDTLGIDGGITFGFIAGRPIWTVADGWRISDEPGLRDAVTREAFAAIETYHGRHAPRPFDLALTRDVAVHFGVTEQPARSGPKVVDERRIRATLESISAAEREIARREFVAKVKRFAVDVAIAGVIKAVTFAGVVIAAWIGWSAILHLTGSVR